MKTTITSKGEIQLPAKLRALDGIEPGDEFPVERIAPGEYRSRVARLRGTKASSTGCWPAPRRDSSSPSNRSRPTRCECFVLGSDS